MPKCVYCGRVYEFPRGLTYVKVNGIVQYFCSSKCRKNKFMNKRKVRWISKSKSVESKKDVKAELQAEEAGASK